MSQDHGVYDPGLQTERTLLAWRRTCLSFGVASLVAMRFTVETAGVLAVFAGVTGAGLAVAAYVAAAVGYRRANTALHSTGSLDHGAAPIALATAAALVLGIACAGYLILSTLR
ncbi:Uncharacterized membrane protein YidH, DUF202 family [Promicromonospora umidemergens]|uniref:DUF202 domain-containing protein n=1 Tax=Promicromonospora umidemergens TaxID=629679 RepID=A0ABP8YC48_9MICO|nr:DUF202 domain-containing protein [Promicromonospora umidemergens]MCP2284670.1 Uncharacterized membrane protein YidH, DUF202 family [Promicromonospora umidemergens]